MAFETPARSGDSSGRAIFRIGRMRILLMATVMALAVPVAGMAQGLPTCAKGLHVIKAGGLNYPATIVAYDPVKGSYQVKYDSGGTVEWLLPRWLKYGCTSAGPSGPTITDAFWVGNWSLFVGPAAQYQVIGGDRYLVVGSGAAAPPLQIKADGSYVWVIDKGKTISGRWRKMASAEMKYGYTDKPGIMLMNGYDGGNWQVTFSDVRADDNRDQLNIQRMDLGVSFLATRMKK